MAYSYASEPIGSGAPYRGGTPAGGYMLELRTVAEILAEMEASGIASRSHP